MTDKKSGLECLREEMKKRGCSEQQTHTKTVAIVLDILASANENGEMHIYQDTQKSEKYLGAVNAEITNALSKLNSVTREIEQKRESAIEEIEKLKEVKTALDNYIEDFKKSLLECESAEGRDRLRAAQMYINTVTIKTGYDNTAFITCLGAILAGQSIGAVKQLKQLNPELFKKTPEWYEEIEFYD